MRSAGLPGLTMSISLLCSRRQRREIVRRLLREFAVTGNIHGDLTTLEDSNVLAKQTTQEGESTTVLSLRPLKLSSLMAT